MKKKILVLAVMAMFASAAASGTLAYFTAGERVHNVITSGGVGIEIVEKTRDANGAEVDFPTDGIEHVMPGTSVSKIVKVKNSGTARAWIRVEVESSMKDRAGEELPLKIGEDSEPVMTYEILDGWIDGQDGYYYYKKPVNADEYTDVLFEHVRFHPKMGNEYQNCIANILISAQSVQADNNGNSVMEAKGWPEPERAEGGKS